MLAQGWSDANWVQPRKRPGRPWRMTMTPARQVWQTGGEALQEGLVQREERSEIVTKLRRQVWQPGGAVAAEGGVEAGHGLPGAGHVEGPGAAAWQVGVPEV